MNTNCPYCNQPWATHGTACRSNITGGADPVPFPPLERGHYQFTPNQLTADEVRKIIREELERAKEKP